jgi:hypothetical protein
VNFEYLFNRMGFEYPPPPPPQWSSLGEDPHILR